MEGTQATGADGYIATENVRAKSRKEIYMTSLAPHDERQGKINLQEVEAGKSQDTRVTWIPKKVEG